ncbi:MAG TPA: DUF1203 domain-containing protein [Stellaceae bacterium]|nr:DUF1203 domain-containing protein [Stellaceae bacterium]
MDIRYLAMPTATAERFRQAGTDDFGNRLRGITAESDRGYICRHCLGQPGKGREALLGSYNTGEPKGHYWQPSPVFICAAPCLRFERENEVPAEIAAIQLVNARPYDADHRLLYDLNDTTTGDRLGALVRRCLEDQRTAFVNVHTGRPGCFLCRVERT